MSTPPASPLIASVLAGLYVILPTRPAVCAKSRPTEASAPPTIEEQPPVPDQSARLQRLRKELHREGPAAIDRFEREMKGHAPLVEPVPERPREVFLTFGLRCGLDLPYAALVKPNLGAGGESPFQRFERTDLMVLTVRVPKDARFTYAIRRGYPAKAATREASDGLNGRRLEADAWNPHRVSARFSYVELPDAPPQPWIRAIEGVPRGRVVDRVLHSDVLGEDRRLGVYLPPGFDPTAGPLPFVVLLDGETYGHDADPDIPTPTILDNLIARGKVPPMLAVFVDGQGTRARDLAMAGAFGDFLARELVPWLRREYRAAEAPSQATLGGMSLGGLGAAYCAFHHSDVFGNVLSQSGSFWFSPGALEAEAPYQVESGAFMREVLAAPRQPLRVWMEVGIFEGAGPLLGGGQLGSNRHLRDLLAAKGYEVSYHEFSGGHDGICWRGSLAEGLIALATPSRGGPAGGHPQGERAGAAGTAEVKPNNL